MSDSGMMRTASPSMSVSRPFLQNANEMPVSGSAHAICMCAPEWPNAPGELFFPNIGVPQLVHPVVAGDDETDRAIDRHVEQRFGERASDVRLRVGEDARIPQPARVVQQRLVVAGHRRRRHDRAAAGHAGRAHGGLVEPERIDVRRVVRPCRASRRVRCRPVPPAGYRGAGERERRGDAIVDDVAEVGVTAQAFDQLREHPMRRQPRDIRSVCPAPTRAPSR